MSKFVTLFSAAALAALGAAQPAHAQLKPGFGVGVVMDFSDKTRVNEASVVNGIVRVNSDSNTSFRPMIDVHAPIWKLSGTITAGPFIGVQLSKEQLVDSLGGGLMVSLPVGKTIKTLNLGLGAVVDPNVRTLGNGIKEDEALPAGETEIRYRNTGKIGLLFMTSVGF